MDRLAGALSDALAHVAMLMQLLAADTRLVAFKAAGEPADPELIAHLSKRTVDTFLAMVDWGRSLRALRSPSDFRVAFGLAADLMRHPVQQFIEFIEDIARQLDESLSTLDHKSSRPIEINGNLSLCLADGAQEALKAEFENVVRGRESGGR
jgi:hypothetical protein